MEPNTTTGKTMFSTPLSTPSKRGTKRVKTRQPGSESSADGDLSYLDLDTGSILTAHRENDLMTISSTEFDKLLTKLDKMQTKFDQLDKLEKCLDKLNKLDKLDSIENSISRMHVKLEGMEERLKTAEASTRDLQTAVQFMGEDYDSVKKTQTEHTKTLSDQCSTINSLANENESLKRSLDEIRQMHGELKSQLLDSKCREMRDNLVFTNIPEQTKIGQNGASYEETEEVLQSFLSNKLGLSRLSFERVHRVPTKRDSSRASPRPIVAKFTYFKDRESVRRSGYKLKGTNFGINEQFPDEIEKKRRDLYPLMRHFRKENKRVVLVRDKLFVDGREVRAGEVVLPEGSSRRDPPTGSGHRRWGNNRPQSARTEQVTHM